MKTETMRIASYLLPDPGGEVVRMLLDEIDRLNALLARHNALVEAVEKYCSECDKIDNEYPATSAELDSYLAARAEVDKLLEEG